MSNQIVKKKRKKMIDFPNSMVLQNIYFLNTEKSKFILIGFDLFKDFKPIIVFRHKNAYVEFTLSDWITLTINENNLNEWKVNNENFECVSIRTKNVCIMKVMKKDNAFVKIENIERNRPTNTIDLDYDEYKKCIEMNTYVQNVMKTFQTNWFEVEDYYNMYVHKCNAQKKFCLDDIEYFCTDNANIDTYRLFKEISIFCTDKLANDVSFMF